MLWEPTEYAWQYELIDKLPPSIDMAQLERSLKMAPTERLEQVRKMARFAQTMRRALEHGLRKAP
jgi:hypothetical protein